MTEAMRTTKPIATVVIKGNNRSVAHRSFCYGFPFIVMPFVVAVFRSVSASSAKIFGR